MPDQSTPPSPPLPSASDLVRAFGARAKRSLGQHFLVDPSILDRIVARAGIGDGDAVLEIGPGPGTLTRTLLARGCRVLAIELDAHAVAHLNAHLPHPWLTVIHADALTVDLDSLLSEAVFVVANLPYNVATEIFFRVERHPGVAGMTLMFQREVADRFVAYPGIKAYGPLAILSAVRWRPRIVLSLPPGAFIPRPRVRSAAVRFDRLASPAVSPDLEPTFRRLVRHAFQQRRKTVRNALSGLVAREQLEAAGIDPGVRPETIPVEAYVALAEEKSEGRNQKTEGRETSGR